MTTYTLGLSFDYHDAAAALLCDGEVVAAAEEERFSRQKHDHGFPARAIAFCLRRAGITAHQIDAVAFYEQPFLKFDRIVRSGLKARVQGRNRGYLARVLDGWVHERKFDSRRRICDHLGIAPERVYDMPHHAAHASAAFFCSPFDRATLVTMDGVGEYETVTVSEARDCTITQRYGLLLPDSLGLFYSAFTAFLGFEVNEGEYKVMGMAGFGQPTHLDTMRSLVRTTPDGLFAIDHEYFQFESPEDLPYTPKLCELFGEPREPESAFQVPSGSAAIVPGSLGAVSLHYANIAASLQARAEEVILHVVDHAVRATGIRNVCVAGGVALNSLANARVQRELVCQLYVHPAAGDSGGAIGAALHHCHSRLALPRRQGMEDVYLGDEHSEDEVIAELTRHGVGGWIRCADHDELVRAVVDRLVDGKVVGWMQGRFEWGPRALGNRSILANPMRKDMQEIVNRRIKFREPFRPFAPSVLAEHAHEYFDIAAAITATAPENFMLAVARVRPDKQHAIPAVTHHDGSARVQIVRRETNPLYHRLIQAFGDRTGVPVVLNTSFNLRGEAMVDTPYDALETFFWSEMDALVMGNILLDKRAS
jgi:carbamoyltransferase